jgi:putative hemolysin
VLSHIVEFPGLAGKFAPVGKVRELYWRVQQSPEGFHLENLLAEMRIGLSVAAADQARIPANGPAVVVANHPYGVLDGAILTVLLTRVRPDVKVLTNLCWRMFRSCESTAFCGSVPDRPVMGIEPACLREALAWLRQGGMLALFPQERCRIGDADGADCQSGVE